MDAKEYYMLLECMEKTTISKESARSFFLSNNLEKYGDEKLLKRWLDHNCKREDLISKATFFKLERGEFWSAVALFVLGFLSGVAILYYDGSRPVNLIWYLLVGVALPFLGALVSLFVMLKRPSSEKLHANIAFVLAQSIQKRYPSFSKILSNSDPSMWSSLLIYYAQKLSVFFVLGVFIALVVTVMGKDVAFTWSTTLHVSSETFYGFVKKLSYPWSHLFEDATVTRELVQKSRYFRLGGEIAKELTSNAAILGEWWKFLAMSTLFYAILPRVFTLLLSAVLLKRSLKKALKGTPRISALLDDMREPFVHVDTSHSADLDSLSAGLPQECNIFAPKSLYKKIVGYSIDESTLHLVADIKNIKTKSFESMGAHFLSDIFTADTLLILKGWEAPTLELVEKIAKTAKDIGSLDILILGLKRDGHKPRVQDLNIYCNSFKDLPRVRIVV